jgi:hypothetical protein
MRRNVCCVNSLVSSVEHDDTMMPHANRELFKMERKDYYDATLLAAKLIASTSIRSHIAMFKQ